MANKPKPPKRYKIVTVGDGCCGKTCLQMRYALNDFPDFVYCPTVFGAQETSIDVGGKTHDMVLWDTAGQEDYARLRSLSYHNTDVVIICFSVESQVSLLNVREKWLPEVRHYLPYVPIVLVANKIDLRKDRKTIEELMAQNRTPVTSHDGAAMARKIRAHVYRECSALKGMGVKEVFEAAVRAALEAPPPPKRSICKLL
ncbi:ras-like GTP-binding protein RHO [Galendromus occidentalis]|uniref:Ras-like GTP-binding protein RHO n=1 Tax=Galendromus occidentalis TaxID=34638 RepID=A0AAJ7WIQ2_9ACAR|nr:ras-like GTP-binding protein RHO [Galendromus occidentalis]